MDKFRAYIKVPGGINYTEFSPDENFVGAATVNRTIFAWSIDTSSSGGFRLFKAFSAHEEYINSLAFYADSRRLATASDDRKVRIWSMIDDSYHYESLKAHNGGVTAIALSPDIVVSGSADQTIQIWSFNGSVYNHRWGLTGHNACITSVAISSDSTLDASASQHDFIRICSVNNGTCLYRLQGIMTHQKPLVERKVVRVTKDIVETTNIEPQEGQSYRLGLGAGPEWLNFNESRLIWVPNEYRAFHKVFAISGPNMVWQDEAGQLLMLKFYLPDQ
ncbi:unnamed protein product [Clonostachys solani]|uniref:Mitochondrial division protein 1 n=1 Tax=Clonostachys solani TaxID=160281 RepID=A0A9N9ZL45_9HYPO|nr:unnamed protein product [Clonostachys solani]